MISPAWLCSQAIGPANTMPTGWARNRKLVTTPKLPPPPRSAHSRSEWLLALGGAYSNFEMDDEGDARVKATYGDNYDRLGALKNKYDPTNLSHVNQNIRPAARHTG